MNDNNIRNNEEGIALSMILRVLWDKAVWIALAVAVCVGLAFGYTKLTYVPMYTSNVTIYANSGKLESTSDVSLPTFYAEDFAKIAVEQGVLQKAIDDYGLDTTWQSFRANLNVTIEEENRVVYMSVSDSDPKTAQKMAYAVSEVAKRTMAEAIEVDLATTITPATLPTKPSGSGMVLNLIIGFLAGLFLSGGFFVAIHMIRDRIASVEELESALGVTVLGVIPYQKRKETEAQKKGDTV